MADFSRDPEWVAKLNADPLVAGESQPTATVAALARADERLSREFGKITVPLLILHGTEDHATRPDGSEQFYREAGSTDKTLKLYEGHYHDLLNDLGREEVLADVLSWLETRVNQPIDAEMPLAT
jgi:alpha-beta hydrolase superfamily lysophospholipase